MSTATQYNPQADLNEQLIRNGISKTVYALVTRETRWCKSAALGYDDPATRAEYFNEFEDAWTNKQDSSHVTFFETWHAWSREVVDLDMNLYPFYYPTAGASQAIQHLIFRQAAHYFSPTIHFFEGEYEGYKAMAEAANLEWREHKRNDDTLLPHGGEPCKIWYEMNPEYGDLFFVSQPSAIDGNVWQDFNEWLKLMPENSVVVDATYVGAVPRTAVPEKFNFNAPSIRNVVFSLSKPFGVYYDRIGGVWCREEDPGLFGYKWFKNLTSLRIGTELMSNVGVFHIPEKYAPEQKLVCNTAGNFLGVPLTPSDVYILATGQTGLNYPDERMANYLTRAGKLRVCLSPGMKLALRELDRVERLKND